jgi:hypothetical protein
MQKIRVICVILIQRNEQAEKKVLEGNDEHN